MRPGEALGIYQMVLALGEIQYRSIEEEGALRCWYLTQRCESQGVFECQNPGFLGHVGITRDRVVDS